MTNLERFRTMTAFEIAQYLSHSSECPNEKNFPDGCPCYGSCRECWEDWLHEEAEVDYESES